LGGCLSTYDRNPWRVLAMDSIELVSVGFRDPILASIAESALFPEPVSSTDLFVRTVYDWVLFHRRRTNACSPEAQIRRPEDTLPPRRYQIYVVDGSTEKLRGAAHERTAGIRETVRELTSGVRGARYRRVADILRTVGRAPKLASLQSASFDVFPWLKNADPVLVVEFGGRDAIPITSDAVVYSAWQNKVPPDQQILGSIIVTEGAENSHALEFARLSRIEQAVASWSPRGSQGVIAALEDVPAEFELDFPDLDGLMLFLIGAHEEIATYRVDVSPGTQNVSSLFQDASGAPVPLGELLQRAYSLRTQRFLNEELDPIQEDKDALLSEWYRQQQSGAFRYHLGACVIQSSKADVSATERARSRVEKIASLLAGSEVVIWEVIERPDSDFPMGTSPVIALIGTLLDGTAGTPSISVQPTTLDFGKVTVGVVKNQDVVVTNIGQAPLAINRLEIADAKNLFVLVTTALPSDLPPGGKSTFTLQFSAKFNGTQTASFSITSNDPNHPIVTVALQGYSDG
jgi:hypothetical protein